MIRCICKERNHRRAVQEGLEFIPLVLSGERGTGKVKKRTRFETPDRSSISWLASWSRLIDSRNCFSIHTVFKIAFLKRSFYGKNIKKKRLTEAGRSCCRSSSTQRKQPFCPLGVLQYAEIFPETSPPDAIPECTSSLRLQGGGRGGSAKMYLKFKHFQNGI